MGRPLSTILLKIFAAGFYRAHAGMLLLIFFIMFGMGPPKDLINYHKALMLAFITSPVIMVVVFAVLLLYLFKCLHYVSGQIFVGHQQFLFYSSNSYSKTQQFISWFILQANITLPVLAYAGVCTGVAVYYHYFLSALVIVCYFLVVLSACALFYMRLINGLVDGSKQSVILKLTQRWKKPYFSLYIYYVFDSLKLRYLITKGLSYLIISGVFLMFADVSHDLRVAGIAMLAIAVSHSILIFDQRQFEEGFLIFSKNLPYSRMKLFLSFAAMYFVLLLPETIWLFVRFSPIMAIGLLAFGLSITLLFHSILYKLGLNMEKYMTWVLGLFMILFWMVMFKLIWVLVLLNLLVAYFIFYSNYYKDPRPVEGAGE
jgi:hypothetical protein